jgi:hypothetical protein
MAPPSKTLIGFVADLCWRHQIGCHDPIGRELAEPKRVKVDGLSDQQLLSVFQVQGLIKARMYWALSVLSLAIAKSNAVIPSWFLSVGSAPSSSISLTALGEAYNKPPSSMAWFHLGSLRRRRRRYR